MGEYYIIANPEKRQYLDANSLGMSVKLAGLIGGPLAEILVWLLADGAPVSGGSTLQGAWSGDRIIVAGDEGPSSSVYERAHHDYLDITVEAFEALASGCPLVSIKWHEAGVLDDDSKFLRGQAIGEPPRSPPEVGRPK